MRTYVSISSLIIAGSLLVGCRKTTFVATTREIPVNVLIQCVGDTLFAKVSPLSVNVYENGTNNETVAWNLDVTSTVSEIEIDKKKGGKWPYGGSLPYKVKKNEPGKGDGVDPDARGKYEYSITATCTANGGPRKVVIDPDMIIIRDSRPE